MDCARASDMAGAPSEYGSRRAGEQFQVVAVVGIGEVEAPAAVPVVELTLLLVSGICVEGQACILDAREDRVELFLADLEGVVLGLEALRVDEVEGRRADPHPGEGRRTSRAAETQVLNTEHVRQEPRGGLAVVGWDEHVLEGDRHRVESPSDSRSSLRCQLVAVAVACSETAARWGVGAGAPSGSRTAQNPFSCSTRSTPSTCS